MKWIDVKDDVPMVGELVGTVGSATYDGLAFMWLSSENKWFNQWNRVVKPPIKWFRIPGDEHVTIALERMDLVSADLVRQRRSRANKTSV